ncbi:PhoX family phosphatase [Iodidimonas sp. SYSU 1G8]|uniref:PhoX family protein n=1 Tax=Iodidimonas sp. SYSU 1G8 TaxID=3133967 RepID=UPI0031FF449B
MHDDDEYCDRPFTAPTLGEIIDTRISRRAVLRGGLFASAALASASSMALAAAEKATAKPFTFKGLPRGVDEMHHVAEGYNADILIRWGDAVLPGAPAFDPSNQSAEAQALQFGYNNDYVGFVPLPAGSNNSDHGLLCVNHEYVSAEVMFPKLPDDASEEVKAAWAKRRAAIEIQAHGGSVLEIRKQAGKWQVVEDSRYARRITSDTPMTIAGPAAGHDWMKTSADPTGTKVLGTINNCAGGITPWGTYLMAEENYNKYFGGSLPGDDPRQQAFFRYSMPGGGTWMALDDRFDVGQEPNESFRFGWVVEVNPFDPRSTPVKRTALGRFSHEGAESIVNRDGRVVVYMGDDSRFEYLYKYVSTGRYDPRNPASATGLLDDGTLYVARFAEDGSMTWLPLVFGQNGLDASNGFDSQARVLIETRRAADILGATPMDRPEDVEPNPVTGKVYAMLTNNSQRGKAGLAQPDGPNPRAGNSSGQIVEMTPDGGDHTATGARWELLVQCGDPARDGIGAVWNPATDANGWFSSPDNCAVDPAGNLWVSTDQGDNWVYNSGKAVPDAPKDTAPEGVSADGLWALETEGPGRGLAKMLFRCPMGAEMCGPRFTPDGETLFLAVQHPGDDSCDKWPLFEGPSTFENPATRWPDFKPGIPPRPSVLVITKKGGGKIGS